MKSKTVILSAARTPFGRLGGALASLSATTLGGEAIRAAVERSGIDPALSLVVAAVIVFGVIAIVRESADVLLQSVPAHASIPSVRRRLRELDGVVDVHDLHIWTIGSGSFVLSAHVLLADARISEATAILRRIEVRLHEAFAIDHVTIQFECESCGVDDRIICTRSGSPSRGAQRETTKGYP